MRRTLAAAAIAAAMAHPVAAEPFYPNRYFDDTFTVLTYAPR